MGTKSALVIGSLYFLRRKRSWTSTSSVGGGVFGVLPFEQPDGARVLLAPKDELLFLFALRLCFHTGMATVSITAITPIATSSAAMA